MTTDAAAILGVSIDNVSLEEAALKICNFVDIYAIDGRPRHVITVNMDFIVNTLEWNLSQVRHPELMKVYVQADLATPDGMPLVIISRLLGTPLKERFTGSDLIPRLSQEAARSGKSLYLLGGRGKTAEKTAKFLQQRYPGLVISGIDSAQVHIEGEDIQHLEESDRQIVERINATKPDILLIAFGNPKQELWFHRNRTKLRVPVSIGVGGSFDFYAGSLQRAPQWMQKSGLEWLFRITQEPRLIKRYAKDFAKFGLLVWPSVLYSRCMHSRPGRIPGQGSLNAEAIEHVLQQHPGIQFIPLPNRLDPLGSSQVRSDVDRGFADAAIIILDFSRVVFMDACGAAFLLRILGWAERDGKFLYLTGVGREIEMYFRLNGLSRVFAGRMLIGQRLLAELTSRPPALLRCTKKEMAECVLIKMQGAMDGTHTEYSTFKTMLGALGDRNCIFDLGDLNYIDSMGLGLLVKIQTELSRHGRSCILCSAGERVLQMLEITKLRGVLRVAPNVAAALNLLRMRQ